MPELPEVQTVVLGLRTKLKGRTIRKIKELREGTVFDYSDGLWLDSEIIDVNRRGKYIVIILKNGVRILVHLRMTGKLILRNNCKKIELHDRAILELDNKKFLIFNDIRTFGRIEIYDKQSKIKVFDRLGPEPLENKFDEFYFQQIIKKRKAPIKNLLLNQSLVAGLGNIYVSEILFRAGISPLRSGESLRLKEIKRIVEETKLVLAEAIKQGGTTISDYRNADDKRGSYQKRLRVYGKKTCLCGESITKIKQAGRSSYYCSHCQK